MTRCSLCGFTFIFIVSIIFIMLHAVNFEEFYKSDLNSILQTVVYVYIGSIFIYFNTRSSKFDANTSMLASSFVLDCQQIVEKITRKNKNRFKEEFNHVDIDILFKLLANKVYALEEILKKKNINSDCLVESYFNFKKSITGVSNNSCIDMEGLKNYKNLVNKSHGEFIAVIDRMKIEACYS